MTKGKQLSKCKIEIYDPRERDRAFVLSNGELWHSRGSDLVFFETASYGHFTNGNWLLKLLEFLIEHTSASHLTILVDSHGNLTAPEFLERTSLNDGMLRGEIPLGRLEDIRSFYDSVANYGVWIFSGVDSPKAQAVPFERLPDILTCAGAIGFHVEVDLDGILIGFLLPSGRVDNVVKELKSL